MEKYKKYKSGKTKEAIQFNTQIFIDTAQQIHGNLYKYDKTIYTGMRNPVIVTCRFHGDFNIKQCQQHVSTLKCGCPTCGKMTWLPPVKFYSILKILNCGFSFKKTIYYKYAHYNGTELVTATCNTHGDFQTTAFNLSKGKGCKQCDIENYNEEFIQQVQKIHPEYSYHKTLKHTTNNKELVTATCNIHGDFNITSRTLLSEGIKCKLCISLEKKKKTIQLNIDKTKNNKLEIKQVVEDIQLKYPKVQFSYNEDDITHILLKSQILTCTCTVHNKTFNSRIKRLIDSTPYLNCYIGCTTCKMDKAGRRRRTEKRTVNKDRISQNLKLFTHMKYSLHQYNKCIRKCVINCYCKIHEIQFQNTLGNVQETKFGGCQQCFSEWRKQPKKTRKQFPKPPPKNKQRKEQIPKYNTEQFIEKCKEHWDENLLEGYDFSETKYKGMNRPVYIICKEHGGWSPKASNFVRGHGCHFCGNKTRFKKYEAQFVKELQLIGLYNSTDYITQYRIKCPNKDYFVDFCFSFNDTLLFIEIDEAHHTNHQSIIDDNNRDNDIMAQYPNCTIVRVNFEDLQYGIDEIQRFFNWC